MAWKGGSKMCGFKAKSILSLIFLLLAASMVWGAPEGAGKAAYPLNPSVVVMPNAVDLKGGKVEVLGAGFTPGTQVTVGFPYLPVHKKLPHVKGVWLGVAIVGEGGAFSMEVDLSQSLGRLARRRVIKKEGLLGVHTFMAKNIEGETATVPFMVKEAEKK
jgi:hypothetical protein